MDEVPPIDAYRLTLKLASDLMGWAVAATGPAATCPVASGAGRRPDPPYFERGCGLLLVYERRGESLACRKWNPFLNETDAFEVLGKLMEKVPPNGLKRFELTYDVAFGDELWLGWSVTFNGTAYVQFADSPGDAICRTALAVLEARPAAPSS